MTARCALDKLFAGVALAICAIGMAGAQTFPAKALRFIGIATPGSPSDVVGRAVAEPLARQLGHPVVVASECKPPVPDSLIPLPIAPPSQRVDLGSDVDLAVVLPDAALKAKREVEIVTELRQAAGRKEHGLDLILFRRSWFDAMAGDGSALAATVRREGRVLA